MRQLLTLCLGNLALLAGANAQPRAIDTEKSVMTVNVSKAGVLGGFGHNHEVAAPIAQGSVDASARQVELHTKAGSLKVSDPQASAKDRAEIQAAMLGPEVLDAERYPEIVFRSTAVEAAGTGAWKVRGNLTLHGQTHPVALDVREAGGHYVGAANFKQTDFGIKPIKIAGGMVRVKDEIRVEFDIQLAR